MKQMFKKLLRLFTLTMLVCSCVNEVVDLGTVTEVNAIIDDVSTNSIMTRSVNDSLTYNNDSILSYPMPESISRQAVTYASSSDIYSDIYGIRELPVNIVVRENILNAGRYLTSTGAGQEIRFSTPNNSDSQKFYIKVLPASTGIPYQIYSYKENRPISVGYYSNDPDTHILFTTTSTNSTWGTSWDFYSGNLDGALVIKNNDIMDGGPNYWEMYNVVIGAERYTAYLGQYNGYATQQFDIVPLEEFEIKSLQFINDQTATYIQTPSKVLIDTYVNNTPIQQSYTLSVSEVITESSSFTHKGSVSLKVDTGFTVKAPYIAEGSIQTSVTTGYDITYGTSSTTQRTISHSYPITVPAGYKAELTIALSEDTIDMNYNATCQGVESGRTVQMKGVWHGVSVSQGDAYLNMYNLSTRTAPETYIFNKVTQSWDRVSN